MAVLANFDCPVESLQPLFPKGTQLKAFTQVVKVPRNKKLWSLWQKPSPIPLSNLGNKFIFFNLEKRPNKFYSLKGIAKENLALVMWEPPTVLPKMYSKEFLKHFGVIFTFDDDLVDNKRFFKFYYPSCQPMRENLVPFEDKKLCTLMATNLTSNSIYELYSERRRAVDFFETKPEGTFDLYGKRWSSELKTWRGYVENKLETLKEYRFSICFENTRGSRGYITEKIFDCFAAGVIPIYLGPSNIEDYIPKECFIDMRTFASYEELYEFITAMSKDEYNGYLNEIRIFLDSETAKRFTSDHLAEIFHRFIVNK